MRKYSRIMLVLALVSGFSLGAAAYAAEDSHGSGHTSGGKGKGPKYQGGDRGSSHSSESHKGGSSHHDSDSGGSKSVEGKVFEEGGKGKGPKYMGGKSGAGETSHEEGTEHTH